MENNIGFALISGSFDSVTYKFELNLLYRTKLSQRLRREHLVALVSMLSSL